MFEYDLHIEKSNRKSISLTVDIEGTIYVKAPNFLQDDEINDYILTKQRWLKKTINELSGRKEQRDKYLIQYGNKILFKGKEYILTKNNDSFSATQLKENRIYSSVENDYYLELDISEFMQYEARNYYYKYARKFSVEIGVQFKELKVSSARKRWGSCSAGKNINLNWRLIMAPEEVIQSVIKHELCHLKELNHSGSFWELLNTHSPNYKNCDKWLKDHSFILTLY